MPGRRESKKKRVSGLEETVMGLLWQTKFEAFTLLVENNLSPLDHKKEQKQHGP